MVALCAALCPDVELTAEDATRGEPEFLAAVLRAAIGAGAKTVTLCDATGEKTPDELTSRSSTRCWKRRPSSGRRP